jgi:hypothetical protein
MDGDRAEIFDEIVRQLGAEAKRAELEHAIDDSFWFHRSLDRIFARASMTAMIEDARQIADLIARLENKLADSSRTLLYDYLLTPPWARTDRAVPADDPWAERRAYEKTLLGPLWQMRLDCERLLAERSEEKARNWDEGFVGRSGPEFDRDQRRCATLGYAQMKVFSDREISSYDEGPYFRITSLLYEAMTDHRDVDLRQHCEAVIKAAPRLSQHRSAAWKVAYGKKANLPLPEILSLVEVLRFILNRSDHAQRHYNGSNNDRHRSGNWS